jgi:hypothetical protein
MARRHRILGVLLTIAVGFVATGCYKADWNAWGESITNKNGNTLSVFSLTRGDKPYAVFVVKGRQFLGATDFKTLKTEGVKSEGVLHSPLDGGAADIPWSCVTRDGATGTVAIGEETFELAKGNLFQIVFEEENPKVKQSAVECKWRGETFGECMSALAEAEPEIQTFADQWQKAEQLDAADSR